MPTTLSGEREMSILDQLVDACHADPDAFAPDAALDLVQMMKPLDWNRLRETWRDRAAAWRENCAYVLGEGPPEGVPVLSEMLFDTDDRVAAQAADSLCAAVPEWIAEARRIALDGGAASRALELADRSLPGYPAFAQWSARVRGYEP